MILKTLMQILLNTRTTPAQARNSSSFKDGASAIVMGDTGTAPEDGFIHVSSAHNHSGGASIFLTNVTNESQGDIALNGWAMGTYVSLRMYVPIAKGQSYKVTYQSQDGKTVRFLPRAF